MKLHTEMNKRKESRKVTSHPFSATKLGRETTPPSSKCGFSLSKNIDFERLYSGKDLTSPTKKYSKGEKSFSQPKLQPNPKLQYALISPKQNKMQTDSSNSDKNNRKISLTKDNKTQQLLKNRPQHISNAPPEKRRGLGKIEELPESSFTRI